MNSLRGGGANQVKFVKNFEENIDIKFREISGTPCPCPRPPPVPLPAPGVSIRAAARDPARTRPPAPTWYTARTRVNTPCQRLRSGPCLPGRECARPPPVSNAPADPRARARHPCHFPRPPAGAWARLRALRHPVPASVHAPTTAPRPRARCACPRRRGGRMRAPARRSNPAPATHATAAPGHPRRPDAPASAPCVTRAGVSGPRLPPMPGAPATSARRCPMRTPGPGASTPRRLPHPPQV